jgi:hypothetical protein
MDPISNADRLVLLLRQKLQERAKAGSAGKPGAKQASNVAGPAEPAGVHAPIPIEGADERPFRRAVIQNILADQLGPALMNDAQFQQVVSRVTDAIEEDTDASELLSRVIADLRRSG